jgi:hypothetical protein
MTHDQRRVMVQCARSCLVVRQLREGQRSFPHSAAQAWQQGRGRPDGGDQCAN